MTDGRDGGGPRRDGGGSLEPGDVFVVANDTTETDPRKGIKGYGRILHCDHALTPKAEIWTGEFGLVIGLAIDQSAATLYASCPQLSKLMAFGAEADERPAQWPPRRRYGNMVFDPRGRILIGVHSGHGEPPPEDGHGDGKLVRFDPATGDAMFFDVAIDGGRGGKHFVSNLALAPDGRTVVYVSEAGRRVCRYDVEAREQRPDLLVMPDGDEATYGMGLLPDGRMVMATSIGASLFDAEGRRVKRYDVPAMRGWTRAKLSPDGRHFYLGNFLEGLLQRREIESGAVVAELDIGRRGGLTSVVEYAPGAVDR